MTLQFLKLCSIDDWWLSMQHLWSDTDRKKKEVLGGKRAPLYLYPSQFLPVLDIY
jgi:hypothetical protein